MTYFLRRMGPFDSEEALKLESRVPGTYEVPFEIQGNSLLSTLFIEEADPGATILASYWDYTAGQSVGEEYPLAQHKPILIGHDRLTVTRIHNKPQLRVVVSGGNVKFSVYITVVDSFASDMDSSLQGEGDPVSLERDRGIPLAAYEITSDKWSFLRTHNGRLQIDVPGVLQVTQQTANFRRYNQSLGLVPSAGAQTHIDYTVPVGKRLFWSGGRGSADSWAKWTVEIDGARWLTERNSFDGPSVTLSIGPPTILSSGQRIIVTAEATGKFGTATDVESWLFGSLEDV